MVQVSIYNNQSTISTTAWHKDIHRVHVDFDIIIIIIALHTSSIAFADHVVRYIHAGEKNYPCLGSIYLFDRVKIV